MSRYSPATVCTGMSLPCLLTILATPGRFPLDILLNGSALATTRGIVILTLISVGCLLSGLVQLSLQGKHLLSSYDLITTLFLHLSFLQSESTLQLQREFMAS